MSCINKTNDESLIYVLVSGVFHNVHFRHFGELKMRFLLIRQRVILKLMILYIRVLGLEISANTTAFSL